ncbi:MAG: bacillithiol biosynthesis cysteine-adding enzyme BshC [Flavobacterium sp.]|nr:MAG: bacillithiol biosynthesis cysteine-adding enzyme BshC [Flavobacterium sp.]
MPIETIPYQKTGYFSKLICDYLAEEESVRTFYHRFPSIESLRDQIEEKNRGFDHSFRKTLVTVLEKQVAGVSISEATQTNIESLQSENTYTVTTGHQLNLFTGPLYFLYKIISVINLSEALKKEYPDYHFVPVYWMATEDHDFEEINFFNFRGKKIRWNRSEGGAVGELSTEGLDAVLEIFEKELGSGKFNSELRVLFESAYIKNQNLAKATQYLANELFGTYGLVIVDGNDNQLKTAFIPYALQELEKNTAYTQVTETSTRLKELGYPEQVSPREINLFYLKEGLRERIIEQDGLYHVNNTQISFTRQDIINELHSHPERFSPNALLRPLYQEVILPNLCYIGGGGELAYWFQLKQYFDTVNVTFPVLLLRNSALLIQDKSLEKLRKLQLSICELFLPVQELENLHTHRISEIDIDFSEQREFLKQQFRSMYEIAQKTDASFLGAVAAQEKKQLNGLDKLEKRLLKAQRRKLSGELERITSLQEELFPGDSLQERHKNFSEFYMEYGPELLSVLKKELDPLVNKFTVISW